MRKINLSAFIVLIFLFSSPLFALDLGLTNVDVQSDSSSHDFESNLIKLKGNVVIKTREATLKCDYIQINKATHDFEAIGNVHLTTDEKELSTDQAWGNLKTEIIEIGPFTGVFGPWFLEGEKAKSQADKSILSMGSYASTCAPSDEYNFFHITASETKYTEDGKIVGKNAIVYMGGVPVMWFPRWTNRIEGNDGVLKIRPGYSGDFGAFLLTSYNWEVAKNFNSTFKVDLMSDRGVAVGNETKIDRENYKTELDLYYLIEEQEVPFDSESGGQKFDGRFKAPDGARYRYFFKHWHKLTDNLTFRARYEELSDFEFSEDFFPDYFTRDVQAFSYFDLEYLEEQYSLSLNIRPKVNDFYNVVERLPELRFETPRIQVEESNLYYSTENSLTQLETSFLEVDKPLLAGGQHPNDYDALRFDTKHFLYYDHTYNDWLKFIPRAGIRLTHYTDSSEQAVTSNDLSSLFSTIDPIALSDSTFNEYDSEGGELTRIIAEIGFETSFKAYNKYDDLKSDFWKLDGGRHIIQPYMNYNYIPEVSEDRDHIYFFDEVDRINEQHFVRLGVDQRLQTTTGEKTKTVHDFIRLENFADFHLESEEGNDGVGDFGTRFELNPVDSSFRFYAESLVDLRQAQLNTFSLGSTIQINENSSLDIRYTFRDDYTSRDLFSNGSTLSYAGSSSGFSQEYVESESISANLKYRLTKTVHLQTGATYNMTEEEFTIYYAEIAKRWSCVTTHFRYEDRPYRRDRNNDNFQAFIFMVSLNAYPQAAIGNGSVDGTEVNW